MLPQLRPSPMPKSMTENNAAHHPEKQWFSVGKDRIALIRLPEDRLHSVTSLIDGAQVSLKLFYYMFEDDIVGTAVLAGLIAALERGVAVRLMIDSFGSSVTREKFFEPFVEAGGNFGIFSPRFNRSYFIRNHQKMLIVDDSRALIGGFNIGARYFAQNTDHISTETSWEDAGLIVEGPSVGKLAEYYAELSQWIASDNSNIRTLRKMIRRWDCGQGALQWLVSGPSNRLSRWASCIKRDLDKGYNVTMVMAYFSPGQGMLRRIARVANKRGKASLILAGKSDNGATIGASRLLYGYLLKRKVEISEYEPRLLHAKLVVIDDVTYVGSANFDMRSLFINVEIMLRIESSEFAAYVREEIQELRENSTTITPALHKSRLTFWNRIRWTLAYFAVSTVDYTVTRRLNFGIRK